MSQGKTIRRPHVTVRGAVTFSKGSDKLFNASASIVGRPENNGTRSNTHLASKADAMRALASRLQDIARELIADANVEDRGEGFI